MTKQPTINQLVAEFAKIIESPATKSLKTMNPFDQAAPAKKPAKKSSKKKAAA